MRLTVGSRCAEFNSQYGSRFTELGLCSNVLVKERIWKEMPRRGALFRSQASVGFTRH